MRSRRLLVIAATTASIAGTIPAAFGASSTSNPPSGLRGHVLYGPTCPVQRAGQSCTRPYSATIRILHEPSGKLAAIVRSGARGDFSVRLPPGRYLLRPQSGRPYPRGSPQGATVYRHRYTTVTIRYDSGIR